MQDVSVVVGFGAATHELLIESDGEEEEDAIKIQSLGKQLHAIGVLRLVAYFSDTVEDTFASSLRRLHAEIRRERSKSARQTTSDSCFT